MLLQWHSCCPLSVVPHNRRTRLTISHIYKYIIIYCNLICQVILLFIMLLSRVLSCLLQVERIAKTYLRHPVVIKIGDEDTGKNKRIEQRIQFITEAQKKARLVEELHRLTSTEKAIVFINSKKQGDSVGRYLDGLGMKVSIIIVSICSFSLLQFLFNNVVLFLLSLC